MRCIHPWSMLWLTLATPLSVCAGWPFTAEGPVRGSPAWYEMHAGDPVGQRQVVRFGKIWPGVPRPIGEPTPLVHRLHHNLNWPHPYTELDKAAVQQIADIQVMNGWQDATTFYDYHFESDTQSLNKSGREHLYWLMSSVPMAFRTAYIQTSMYDPSLNDTRLATVQNEAVRLVGAEQAPQVLLRVATPHGTPAADVDAVFQYRRDNLTPPPVLQQTAGTE